MFSLQSTAARSTAFSLGVLSHIAIFNRGEWDVATGKICVIVISSQALGVAGLLHYVPEEYESPIFAFKVFVKITSFWVIGIFTSILIYRAFFHRLNGFPGPYLARLSNLYPTFLTAKRLHLYEEVQSLHNQYGDFVRLGQYHALAHETIVLTSSGPSELSINDPRAVMAIHGPQSKCVKGPWYNVLHPSVSLQMIRNKPDHIRRRKVWDRGFSAKGMILFLSRSQEVNNARADRAPSPARLRASSYRIYRSATPTA
jgi:hypothetical protein